MQRELVTLDGSEAAAYIAYKTNEVIAIYRITPSPAMGEFSDESSAANRIADHDLHCQSGPTADDR